MRSLVVMLMLVVVVVAALSMSACLGQDYGGDVTTATPPSNGNGEMSRKRALVPAMFVFGDSLIDNGNNNNLPSFAKANYYPYGIDFNDGPTGRFSNAYTIVDAIAESLGLPLTPAYSEARGGDQMRYGVNYASAAAGILDATGRNFVGRIPFNQQVRNFESTLDQITANLGADEMSRSLAQCLFFVGMGSNDYLNNYLMPNYPTRNQYNAQQYANLLVQQYTTQLTKLYNLGGRKFAIAGLGMMGCIPSLLAQSPTGNCSEAVNLLVQPFNANVKTMLNNLNSKLPGSRFIYVDIANMFRDILARPAAYGFKVIDRGCCGIGRNQGQITCLPFQTPCMNREEYVFWDAFHPTSHVNVILGRRAFNGGSDVSYPMNIQQLATLDIQSN
ncbi:hypothetical protein SOVF_007480 [Spinacia oleracea]|uniref:GDSL esterase/lipase At1g71691 n=1 Tax=Spinacia oleracea TaxID=3562 RepID=A0A9R0I4V2_SPIOL|nr:GDSL esterase/lipase At1g71691-like [Spinacia oleracea]KNA25329.1 hypothetical protein SOVF_007480 [Spinacia oleracea]